MEGRHFALLGSTSIWFICYLISLYYFSYKFSKSLIPIKWRNITNIRTLNKLLLSAILISPIISGLFYRMGGVMEKGNGIAWGCYIEDFYVITLIIWLLLFIILFILLIVFMIKPFYFGFEKRKNIIYLFFFHKCLTLIHIILILIIIPIISGPLSGKTSTCL